ncbi:hypothetical protein FZEAL_552 [Fusarium zealandicum]|uniref:PH-response regulator protein palI/prr-5 n=1 Tax=Fusarium zealandicum TaxID=1053134 RepID=A0A8H4XQS8_9HYPO|nr:hypothetical protein FZEAL_552 [Fusarium zealandicum]
MLRPATPLTVLLFVAFALLLLAVLSTPVIEAIPLSDFDGITYGVFGYCENGKGCSGIGVGYDTAKLAGDNAQAFDLPSGTRNTLSAILIVHPVAALLTLILFIMAAVSHTHAASHSTRFLLIQFIFLFIDFLVCLLAFLIDVLVFVPHLAWGSYLVLAATILVAMSGLVTCAMRRTLISRKDRQRRIGENAEMSGENYYNRNGQPKTTAEDEASRQAALPPMSNGVHDNLPSFASFEQQNKIDQTSDENIPLTRRTTSNRSPIPPNGGASVGEVASFNRSPQRQGSRDQFGNPINNDVPDPYASRRGPSPSMSNRSRGGPGSYRGGRGGYGRGGYDNYGAPMRGRGGYGSQGRGGQGPRGGRGGYGTPPRGAYAAGGMRGARSPPPGYNNGPYDRRPSPANAYGAYDNQPSDVSNVYSSTNPSMPSVSTAVYSAYTPDSALPRAESPPPLPGTQPATVGGQAIEMDASPAQRQDAGEYGHLRDSDADVAGMIGLQQGRVPQRHDTYMSEGSKYSNDEQYAPPAAAWNQGGGRHSPRAQSPLVTGQPAAEVAGRNTPPVAQQTMTGGTSNYYEDVDPRFASETPPATSHLQPPPIEPIYEDIHANNAGARSPAESERSTFTSISQRGINPRWNPNPPPPMPYQQGPHPRRPVQQQQQQQQKRQDVLLDNPDFSLPGSRNARGPGMVPGSAYPPGGF